MSYLGFVPTMVDYLDQLSQTANRKVSILEIGVDRGQTALPLLANLVGRKVKFDWIGVDIRLDNNLAQQMLMLEGVDPHFIEGSTAESTIFYYQVNSKEYLKQIRKQDFRFDLILIDGDHNYDTVKYELNSLYDIAHLNSLVICDDYHGRHSNKDSFYENYDSHKDLKDLSTDLNTDKNKGGVTRAIDEFLKESNENYEIPWKMAWVANNTEPIILARGLGFRSNPRGKIIDSRTGRELQHPEANDIEFVWCIPKS